MQNARTVFGALILSGAILMIATWGRPRARANAPAALPTKNE